MVVILIISREFAVTGLRLVAAGEGIVLAASNMGKLKTVLQISATAFLLLHHFLSLIWIFPSEPYFYIWPLSLPFSPGWSIS